MLHGSAGTRSNPIIIWISAMQMDLGHPRSSMWFRVQAAMATSNAKRVAARPAGCWLCDRPCRTDSSPAWSG